MASPRSHTPKGQRARGRILAAAERLLTVRGFHGTSMRDVAAAARLPLATVVYHFARKEQLHAAVLEAIGAELGRSLAGAPAAPAASTAPAAPIASTAPTAPDAPSTPTSNARTTADIATPSGADRMDAFARGLVGWSIRNPGRVRLLLRELLDNPARVARASRLPLAPVLTEAASLIAASSPAGASTPAFPELAVLHLVGAISYVVAAQPTVARIVGPARAARLAAVYEHEAIAHARHVLGLPADPTSTSPSPSPSAPPPPPPSPLPVPEKEPRHAERPPDRADPPRARPPRAADDRRRARAVDDPDRRVRRRGAPRARARPPVP